MFTPKTALFTFFAACALGVVACQPADSTAEALAKAGAADAEKVSGPPAAEPSTPAATR